MATASTAKKTEDHPDNGQETSEKVEQGVTLGQIDEPSKPVGLAAFPPHLRKLHAGRVRKVEMVWRTLAVDVPGGIEPEMLMEPSYWAHYTPEIRPGDVLWALCEDGSWEGQFRVMFVGSVEITLSPISIARHSVQQTDGHSELYEIVWMGPTARWTVRSKEDGGVVKDRLYPESAAHQWLRQHLAETSR